MKNTHVRILFQGACLALLVACADTATHSAAKSTAQVANPASENCVRQGGKHEVRKRGGGEYGVCVFANSHQCEEWALLRGHCPVGGVRVAGFSTDAARFCAITGGRYEAVAAGRTPAGNQDEKGTCTLPGDKSGQSGPTCDADEYLAGACGRTDAAQREQ